MKAVIKRPGENPEVIEVSGLSDINKLVGNVDENGNGWERGSSDIRMAVGRGIDQYCKEDAINNFPLGANLWSYNDSAVFFGTIVFAGFDKNFDLCSLTDEQIQYCLDYCAKKQVEF